jgi:hypothetical protein
LHLGIFHVFGFLKGAFGGHRFADDVEVKEAVRDWLRAQPLQFVSDGMRQFADCRAKWHEHRRKHRFQEFLYCIVFIRFGSGRMYLFHCSGLQPSYHSTVNI